MPDSVVGMGSMRVSTDPEERLVTYALGSCLGLAVYDPVARVGGLLHAMLPLSTIHPEKARQNPLMFVDTGVPALFRACYAAGALKEQMVVKVAGGASIAADGESDQFQIGKRNLMVPRKLVWKNEVLLRAQDVGGYRATRTMWLAIANGELRLRVNGCDLSL